MPITNVILLFPGRHGDSDSESFTIPECCGSHHGHRSPAESELLFHDRPSDARTSGERRRCRWRCWSRAGIIRYSPSLDVDPFVGPEQWFTIYRNRSIIVNSSDCRCRADVRFRPGYAPGTTGDLAHSSVVTDVPPRSRQPVAEGYRDTVGASECNAGIGRSVALSRS